MNIKARLSSGMEIRSETPNKDLGKEIIRTQNKEALKELKEVLSHEKDTNVIGDVLKVLEVMGEMDSDFTSSAFNSIVQYINHPLNKIQWRAMSALSTISVYHQQALYETLPSVLQLMDEGTVITRDHGVKILLILYTGGYEREMAPLLTEQVLGAPDNQVGQYAEKWSKIIKPEHISLLIHALENRSLELDKPTHLKRANKILISLKKKGSKN